MPDCTRIQRALLDNGLNRAATPALSAEEVQAHLSHCPECSAFLSALDKARHLLTPSEVPSMTHLEKAQAVARIRARLLYRKQRRRVLGDFVFFSAWLLTAAALVAVPVLHGPQFLQNLPWRELLRPLGGLGFLVALLLSLTALASALVVLALRRNGDAQSEGV